MELTLDKFHERLNDYKDRYVTLYRLRFDEDSDYYNHHMIYYMENVERLQRDIEFELITDQLYIKEILQTIEKEEDIEGFYSDIEYLWTLRNDIIEILWK